MYLYFVIVVGFLQSNDPESYASGSVAIGRASHAGQVKGEDPDKKGYPDPPGCGLRHEANNLTSVKKKTSLLRSLIMDSRWIILAKDQGKVIRIMISVLLLGRYSAYIEQEC
jgi:hypothetical protein